jgi:hypothetical protein
VQAAVQDHQQAIAALEGEREKYHLAFQKLESRLQEETERVAREKMDWKDRSLTVMQDLAHQEQAVRMGTQRAEDLERTVRKLGDRDIELGDLLTTCKEETAEVAHARAEMEVTIKHDGLLNNKLHKKLAKCLLAEDVASGDLKASGKQQEVMDEKLHQLMAQLQAAEQGKEEAEINHRKLYKEKDELTRSSEIASQKMEATHRRKHLLDRSGQLLDDKNGKQKKQFVLLRKQVAEITEKNRKLEAKLQAKDDALMTMQEDQHYAAEELMNEVARRAEEK